jgi:hypothetical protein
LHAKLRQKEIENSRSNVKKVLKASLENPLEEFRPSDASSVEVESGTSSESNEFADYQQHQKKTEEGERGTRMGQVRTEFERR